jgi:hypothetical protein
VSLSHGGDSSQDGMLRIAASGWCELQGSTYV